MNNNKTKIKENYNAFEQGQQTVQQHLLENKN